MASPITTTRAFLAAVEKDNASDRACQELDLADARLGSAQLSGTRFEHCAFPGASLRSADLTGSTFTHCRFFDAEREVAANFSYANLREASFEGCDLTTAEFTGARAYDLALVRCQAQGANFSGVDFRLPVGKTDLAGFRAEDCNLAYADFSDTFLGGTTFVDCRLVHAQFAYAVLNEAVLTGSDLSNIETRGLSLTGADLRGATFNNLDPRTIELQDVTIDLDQCLMLLGPLGIQIDVPE